MIKGILFDKDGTLVDFHTLWLQAALNVTDRLLVENHLATDAEMKEYILDTIGVKNSVVDPKGGLAYKSYEEIATDIHTSLKKKLIYLDLYKLKEQLIILFNEFASGKDAVFRPTANVKKVIEILKMKGIRVGMATADTEDSARNCLEKLGILEKFDYIGADNGVRKPKPEPDMFMEFGELFQLKPEEIAVVGDTYNDMLFAKKNGGVAVGVLSGVSDTKDFEGKADYIIGSVEELPELLCR